MVAIPTNPDVVIIGAGAAGIGAGLALTRLQIPFVILEAKNRIGGRAYSEDTSIGGLWDHGCHWLHSAEINPLRVIADKIGHPYRATTMEWVARYYLNGNCLDDHEIAHVRAAVNRYFEQADEPLPEGSDRAAAELIDRTSPYATYLRDVVSAITSAPPDELSLRDNNRYAGTDLDYPVSGGYGALMARLATELPIRLNCPVTGIEVVGSGVTVAAPQGNLRVKAVILTVSVGVLAAGRIALSPGLPGSVTKALQHVRLGDVEKIALEVTGRPFDGMSDTTIRVAEGSQGFFAEIHPYGRPLIVTHVSGPLGRELSGSGDKAAGDFITDRLVNAFGANVRKAVGRAKVTTWRHDPDVQGAYSYVRVGHADAREALIAADLAPLYLAGEAMTLDHYSTCHGAYLSGLRTAHKAASRLGAPAPEPDPLWLPEDGTSSVGQS